MQHSPSNQAAAAPQRTGAVVDFDVLFVVADVTGLINGLELLWLTPTLADGLCHDHWPDNRVKLCYLLSIYICHLCKLHRRKTVLEKFRKFWSEALIFRDCFTEIVITNFREKLWKPQVYKTPLSGVFETLLNEWKMWLQTNKFWAHLNL